MSKRSQLNYQQTFILGAYVYWLAILAFVTGDRKSSFYFQEALQTTLRNMDLSYDIVEDIHVPESHRRIFPHPLTGFSMRTCTCVGKVGSLCRWAQAEAVQGLGKFSPNRENHQRTLETKARFLERELLALFQARQSNFQDPQDPQTDVDEILAVGEAYRCAGLLQLYMSFPQLIPRWTQNSSKYQNEAPTRDISFEFNIRQMDSGKGFGPSQHNWLRGLALHILSILETIPPTSGTRVLQGLPVLIASTWFVDHVKDDPCSQTPFKHPRLALRISSTSKEEARKVVRNGLRIHAEYVGLQQVSRVLEIVEEVWRRDDKGPGKV